MGLVHFKNTISIPTIIHHMISLFLCLQEQDIFNTFGMVSHFSPTKPTFLFHMNVSSITVQFGWHFGWLYVDEELWVVKNIDTTLAIDEKASLPVLTCQVLMVDIPQFIFTLIFFNLSLGQLSMNLSFFNVLFETSLCIMTFFIAMVTSDLPFLMSFLGQVFA